MARLRPLVARIVEELTRQLASRLRPALDRAHHAPADPPARRAARPAAHAAGQPGARRRRDEDGRVRVRPGAAGVPHPGPARASTGG